MPYYLNSESDNDSQHQPSDNEYDSDDNSDDEYEEYYADTQDVLKENKEHYIGICKLMYPEHYFLLLNTISSNVFYKHPFQSILKYLTEFSIVYVHKPQIDIMQLHILKDDTYTIIKKTHWLRLIQRHWKKVFSERQNIHKKRFHSIMSVLYTQMHCKSPNELNTLPGLHGMLSHYNVKVNKYKN